MKVRGGGFRYFIMLNLQPYLIGKDPEYGSLNGLVGQPSIF